MKKYGKYEKRPEGVPAKQPKVKSALLQTYLTSLLCMVLCVTMFFGTSYAWFTSEVTNEGNEIYVGTLKVGLYKLKNGSPVSLASSDTNKETLFNGDIRWEPGYTSLETIQVVNEGDLSFKYDLSFTDGTISEGGNLAAVAENFEVWVFNHFGKEYEAPSSYDSMKASSDWEMIGTLDEVLNGKAVLENRSMYTVRTSDEGAVASTEPNPGTADGVPTTDTYTIALHMKKETSDANLMGKKITLNVKLVAYQRSGENSESDAFGPTYDDFAELTEIVEKQVKFNEYNAEGISCVGLSDAEQTVTLDAAYQFRPDVSHEEVVEKNPPFRYWHADFVVSADQDVPANSVALAGYYKLYCELKTNGAWVALTSPEAIKAGQEIRLIEAMGEGSISVNYEEICNFGNDGTGFLCGILDIPENDVSRNEGTTITVELRLYETEEPSEENGNSHNKETGRYIVVGSYSYTFPSAAQSN